MNYLNRQSHSLLLLLSFLLCSILSSCTTQEERQRYAAFIEHADSLNKADQPLPSDSLLKDAADWYDRHGTANERMRAHYLLGRCYHDLGEAPRALECYQHAAEQADTTRKDCDLYTLCAVYGQMADLYHFQNLPMNEIAAFASCEKVAWKSKDTLTALRCRELQIRPYYLLGDTTKVLQIVSYMNRMYKENGYENFAVSAFPVSIYIHIKRGNYSKAREQMNAYEAQSGFFDKLGNISRGREHYYYSKGLYYMGVHRIDSAETCFRKVGQAGFQKECYKGLLEVYRHHVQPDSVSKYSQLYEAALDTLHNQMRTETVGNITSLYNYQQMEKENHKLQQINEQTRWYSIVMALLVLIAIFILIAYYQYTQKRIIANQRRIQLLQQVNEKITRGKQNTINQQNGLNDSLNTQIKQSKDCLQQLEMRKKRELTMSILASEVGKKARKTAKEQDGKFSESDWQEIFKLIDKNFPSFKQSLHILHKISDDEYKICVLEILEFKNIEIAHLLFKEPSTISTSRKRIFEKLSSSKGSATDLRTFLYSI